MKPTIEHAYWKEWLSEMYKDIPWEIEVELKHFNDYIDLYNLLPENSDEKLLVFEYLRYLFTKPVAENIWIDLWVPLLDRIDENNRERSRELFRIIEKIKKNYQGVINPQS